MADTAPVAPARWRMLLVLTAAYGVAQLDRNAINLLLPDIQRAYGLSDGEAGLLSGTAFVLLFSVASLPLGVIADRVDRRRLLALGLVAWSGFTGLCGLARSFPLLVAARLGVGIGEATLAPCAYPMIVGAFPERAAGRAVSAYVAGATALSGVLLALTGRLARDLSAGPGSDGHTGIAAWRLVFLALTAPGLALAAMVGTLPGAAAAPPRVSAGLGRRIRGLVPLFLGSAAFYGSFYAVATWTPTIFARRFGLDVAATGALLGAQQVLSGVCGALAGGALVDRSARRIRAAIGVALISMTALAMAAITIVLAPTLAFAVGAALAGALFGGLALGTLPAAVQLLVPEEARSRAAGAFILAINVLGTGLGPPLAGFASTQAGNAARGLALATLTLGLVGAMLLFRADRTALRPGSGS